MADSILITKLNEISNIKNDIKAAVKTGLSIDLTNKKFSEYAAAIRSVVMAPYTPDGTPVEPGKFGKTSNTLSSGNTMYYNGDFYAYRVINAVWNDYAEFFEAEGEWEYGDIIELDPLTKKYCRAKNEDSQLVVGVASNTYGSIVGGDAGKTIEENLEKYIPIGLMGRVNVKVKGDIRTGDLISTSDIPGVGKKSDGKVGTVIGKALASVSTKNDYSIIPMLILRG